MLYALLYIAEMQDDALLWSAKSVHVVKRPFFLTQVNFSILSVAFCQIFIANVNNWL